MFSKNFSKMRAIDESKLIYAYIEARDAKLIASLASQTYMVSYLLMYFLPFLMIMPL